MVAEETEDRKRTGSALLMSNEMFYIDKDGKKSDAAIHEEILGDDDGLRIKSYEHLKQLYREAGQPID